MPFSEWMSSLFSSNSPVEEETIVHDLDSARLKHAQPPPPSLADIVLGGRYRLELLVGRGASAAVYRAHDIVLEQTVAIKLLHLDQMEPDRRAKIAQALRDETRHAMALAHPRILRVYNYERTGDWDYVVMEFVEGESLHHLVERRTVQRLSPRAVFQYGVAVLEGLEYAHSEGVIHNDLKPSNVMRGRNGSVKICDFGLASMAAAAPGSKCAGTPAFMPPERIRGEASDQRSDLYSLAATLYALGNGRPPFGAAVADALAGHLHSDVPRASVLPDSLHSVLAKGLAKDPADRFADAADMSQALIAAARVEMYKSTPLPRRPALEETPTERDPIIAPQYSPVPAPEERVPRKARVPADLVEIESVRLDTTHESGPVDVEGFFMERAPVTNVQYAEFIAAFDGPAPPLHWKGLTPPRGLEAHPVVGITREDAAAYAAWKGRRLPTHLEWEAAARPANRRLPWGEEYDPELCCGPHNANGTEPVGSRRRGHTPVGVSDLLGNVWEWTTTTAGTPPDEGYAWVYGGSFLHSPVGRDDRIARTSVSIYNAYDYLGFRCVVDAETP